MSAPLYSLLFSIALCLHAGPGPAEKGRTSPQAPAASSQQGPKGKGAFGIKYIGENSSYSHPAGESSDAIETVSRQQAGQGTFGPITSDGKPTQAPAEPAPAAHLPVAPPSANAAPEGGGGARPPAWTAVPPVGQPSTTGVERPAPAAEAAPEQPSSKGVARAFAGKAAPEHPEDRSRYSLWEGLSAPLTLPSEKVKEVGPDTAEKLGRQDYQAHILGSGSPAGRFIVEPFSAAAAEGKAGEIFVRFELDLAKAAAVRPAETPAVPADGRAPAFAPAPVEGQASVPAAAAAPSAAPGADKAADPATAAKNTLAELSRLTGFRTDARFEEPLRDAVADHLSVRGWIASDRIAAAMRMPDVSMLEIEPRSARPAYGVQAETDILIGIRVPKGANALPADLAAGSGYSEVLRRLETGAGFQLKRTIGYQEVPGGREAVVVVSGRLPVRNISRILADSGIVKIASSPDAGSPDPEASSGLRRSFLGFAMSRSPLLVIATLIVLLSPLSLGLYKLLQVFVPYQNN